MGRDGVEEIHPTSTSNSPVESSGKGFKGVGGSDVR